MGMSFAAIVGSLRQASYNLQLALTIKERFQDKFELDIVGIGSLPFFNQDLEHDPPETVVAFKKTIAAKDGVLILTPEYNWSVPGVLQNALDWLSRGDKVLIGKPVMIAGASPGLMGTIRAQLHLRQILASPGLQARVLPAAGNEILITQCIGKFDETAGRLTDEATLEFIDAVVNRFIDFANPTL